MRRQGRRCRHLQPLGVLVEHRIDDVDEGFVAVEQSVPPGQQIALQPAFALVLAEHLHDPAAGRQELVVRHVAASHWRLVTSNTASRPLDSVSSGPKMRKLRCAALSFDHVAQEPSEHVRIADAARPRGTATATA